MIENKKELLLYFEGMTSKISDLIEPLLQNFGITHFWYDAFFPDGKYLCLGNDFIWKKYFYEQDFFNTTNYLIEAIKTSPLNHVTCVLWDNFMGDRMMCAQRKFNIGNGINIVSRKNDFIEVYSFASTISNTNINELYIKNINVLDSFISYSKTKLSDIINMHSEKPLGQLQEIDSLFFNTPLSYFSEEKVEAFLQKIQNEKRILKTDTNEVPLSKREFECLSYIALGKSMKETARGLGLSPRTVEFYLQNLKEKTGLSRGALISHYIKNNSFSGFL